MNKFYLGILFLLFFILSCNEDGIKGKWVNDDINICVTDDVFIVSDNNLVDFFYYSIENDTILLKNKDSNCLIDSLKFFYSSKESLFAVDNMNYWKRLGMKYSKEESIIKFERVEEKNCTDYSDYKLFSNKNKNDNITIFSGAMEEC
ncbi:MAG: hypothetical protein R2836_06865 [Chitinophagales bacterium]